MAVSWPSLFWADWCLLSLSTWKDNVAKASPGIIFFFPNCFFLTWYYFTRHWPANTSLPGSSAKLPQAGSCHTHNVLAQVKLKEVSVKSLFPQQPRNAEAVSHGFPNTGDLSYARGGGRRGDRIHTRVPSQCLNQTTILNAAPFLQFRFQDDGWSICVDWVALCWHQCHLFVWEKWTSFSEHPGGRREARSWEKTLMIIYDMESYLFPYRESNRFWIWG